MVSLCHRHDRAGFRNPAPRAASCPGRSGVARLHDVRRGSDTSRQTRRLAVACPGPGLPGGVHPLASVRWIAGAHQPAETREHCDKPMNVSRNMSTNITKKLAGKVALVTGGSRSIGAAIAKRLAADGAAVALTYSASPGKANEVVRSIEAAGGKALAIKADAAETEAVRLAVAKTIGTFGGIDILVNNAGTGIFV